MVFVRWHLNYKRGKDIPQNRPFFILNTLGQIYPTDPTPRVISKLETSGNTSDDLLQWSTEPTTSERERSVTVKSTVIVPYTVTPIRLKHNSNTRDNWVIRMVCRRIYIKHVHRRNHIISYPITSDVSFRGHTVGVESSPQKNMRSNHNVCCYRNMNTSCVNNMVNSSNSLSRRNHLRVRWSLLYST